MKNKFTILSPAGSVESLKKAAAFGSDAVYLGIDKFNARMKAENFTSENLKEWVSYAHLFGIKVYVTLNTMIKQNELKEAKRVADIIFLSGADGMIITDLGLLNYCSKRYKGIELYASTQLSVMNSFGAIAAKSIGATGVVVARESSIKDIEAICDVNDIKVEAFIHGALCVCASGNCYMSSMADGNSGNRGLCAQPCRKRYTAYCGDKKLNDGYLLSPKDLCGLKNFDKLISAGVTTFKIEGRNRRAEYAAQSIKTYKEYLNTAETKRNMTNLKKLFNRGDYTDGYAFEHNTSNIMFPSIQGHCGLKVGRILSVQKDTLKAKIEQDVAVGDAFKIISNGKETGNAVATIRQKKGDVVLSYKGRAITGDSLNITTDITLIEKINEVKPQLKVTAEFNAKIGSKCELILKYNDSMCVKEVSEFVCESAKSRPLLCSDIKKCIKKTGNTVFSVVDIQVSVDEIFLPLSALNDLRRKAFDKLQSQIINAYNSKQPNKELLQCKNEILDEVDSSYENSRILCLSEYSHLDNYDIQNNDIIVLSPYDFCNANIPDTLSNRENGWYLDLPYLSSEADIDIFKKWFSLKGFKGVVANNIYALSLATTFNFNVIGGLGLNIANQETVKVLKHFGVSKYVYSQELNIHECEAIGNGYLFTQGEIYNMTLAHCPYKIAYGYENCADCKASKGALVYKDELGYKFKIIRQKASKCYFRVINGAVLKYENNKYKKLYINLSDNTLYIGYTKGKLIKGVK